MTRATSTLLSPFGDRAVRFVIPAGVSHRRLLGELSGASGVRDVVLAEEIGCVVLDQDADARATCEAIEQRLASIDLASGEDAGSTHAIRVVYDGEDLESVAAAIGRTKDAVVALHSEGEYRVAMLGFLPGFAYLRGLPRELHLPRRAPRPRVPAGSVAIAAEYSGVYPFVSPGGWHLLGRAIGFEAFGANGAALAIGDVVRFVPSSDASDAASAMPPRAKPETTAPAGPHLEITRAAAIVLLVDAGRPGRMHEGVPPGGPLVRSMLARANESAGNAPDACGIEIYGTIEVTARGGSVVIADDASGPVTLRDGDKHVVSTDGRVRARYLALAGGIDAPVRLGSRSVLLVAGLGGVLRRGDRLAPGGAGSNHVNAHRSARTEIAADAPIAIMPGPDAADIELDDLTRSELRIAAASDRTGTRLEGPALAVRSAGATSASTMSRRSTPMVIGAIELTPSGLVVLGPDHPTTGGYPVVAVVRSSSLDALFAKPIGSSVRFAVVP